MAHREEKRTQMTLMCESQAYYAYEFAINGQGLVF